MTSVTSESTGRDKDRQKDSAGEGTNDKDDAGKGPSHKRREVPAPSLL